MTGMSQREKESQPSSVRSAAVIYRMQQLQLLLWYTFGVWQVLYLSACAFLRPWSPNQLVFATLKRALAFFPVCFFVVNGNAYGFLCGSSGFLSLQHAIYMGIGSFLTGANRTNDTFALRRYPFPPYIDDDFISECQGRSSLRVTRRGLFRRLLLVGRSWSLTGGVTNGLSQEGQNVAEGDPLATVGGPPAHNQKIN